MESSSLIAIELCVFAVLFGHLERRTNSKISGDFRSLILNLFPWALDILAISGPIPMGNGSMRRSLLGFQSVGFRLIPAIVPQDVRERDVSIIVLLFAFTSS